MSVETRVFEYDPMTGIKRLFHYDHSTDKFTIETVMDVEPIIEANKRNLNDAPTAWKGEMHRIASVPLNVYMDLVQKGIANDQNALRKWANDPDNLYYRVRGGRV